jgi:lysophospholipase L1-like esterase
MKTILCFGDSNTWGYIPGTDGERFPYAIRMGGILQALLGPGFRVLEEGLCARMSGWDDPQTPDRNARKQLPAILEAQRPLDLVSIMLGTNDLKGYMNLGPQDCARAQEVLLDIIAAAGAGPAGPNATPGPGGGRPLVLLIAPPLVVETPTPFGNTFIGAIPKSLGLAEAYRQVAAKRGCLFLDAGSLVTPSDKDGIHLDAKAHRRLAEAIAEVVKDALG